MSKRDFEAMATAFGMELRLAFLSDVPAKRAMVHVFVSAARQLSPSFDGDRFWAWVDDVTYGRRDANGKKVKGAA